VAEIVAEHPGRLIGFARVYPERDRGRVRSLIGRAVEEYGFRGVKRATRSAC
jgi:predicted TIM-barrel fold metal-dependent hydrolase